jgi:glutamate-1-semialdehyde 2,1-aminomutase
MFPLGERFETGVRAALERHAVPWHVVRLGCRVEYAYLPTQPRTGGEAAAAADHDLDRFLHLFALNRGVLMTPFHNMALMSPATTEDDVDRHTEVFDRALVALFG